MDDTFNSYFDLIRRRGLVNNPQDRATLQRDRRFGELLEVVDETDLRWGGYAKTGNPNNYWDYYFSGQDVKIYVDGTEEDPEFRHLPIQEFAFSVSQQKTPVYGFWSYTYDAIMRGQRIIGGQFSIVTRYPDYMKRLLEKAASVRAKGKSSYRYYRDLTEDDRNIEKYWGKNLDPAYGQAGNHLFSAHPPFSFVIVYGVQNLSLSSGDLDLQNRNAIYNSYRKGPSGPETDINPLLSDVNERLVESDTADQANRIVLEACELTQVQRAIGSDGAVLTETYEFLARDIISHLPQTGLYNASTRAADIAGANITGPNEYGQYSSNPNP